MSQQDGFAGGFLAGALVGGVVGALVGALVASGRTKESESSEGSLLNRNLSEAKPSQTKKPPQLKDEDSLEMARRSLEDKIAQLNSAIDDVRLQLGTVNGNVAEGSYERGYNSSPGESSHQDS
jgi:gas vesicle protein